MKAIRFLIATGIKNSIKQLLKRPGALILYLFFIGIILFSVIVSAGANLTPNPGTRWLLEPVGAALGILTLLYPLFMGVSEGGTLFTMADVGLLFPSPVRPKTILIYGIIKQMTTTLLICIILMAQISNLRMWLGLSIRGAVTVIVAALISIYTIHVGAMLVYAICSAGERWRGVFTRVARMGAVLVAAAVFWAVFETRDPASAAALLMGNPILSAFPVVGWMKSVFQAADSGGMALLLPMLGLVLTAAAVSIALTVVSTDFYEDVLAATEKRQTRIADKRAGRSDVTLFKRGLKLKLHGRGASAIFFRQLSEYARRGFFDLMSLMLVLVMCVTRIVIPSGDSVLQDIFGERFSLMMMGYLMMFFNLQGLWSRELQKPYIYMIPARPFTKLAFAMLLTPFKALADGLLAGIALTAFFSAPPSAIPVYMLLAAAFSAVYTAGDILSRVILGDSKTRMVTMLVYVAFSLLLVVPGCLFIFMFEGLLPGSLLCAAWCFAGSAAVTALCCRKIFEFQAGA